MRVTINQTRNDKCALKIEFREPQVFPRQFRSWTKPIDSFVINNESCVFNQTGIIKTQTAGTCCQPANVGEDLSHANAIPAPATPFKMVGVRTSSNMARRSSWK